jgi:hypothetical protein
MDKITRVLLTAAISILFPVLVYFTANTFLPDKSTTSSSTYSTPTYNNYDSYDCTDDYNPRNPSSCSYNGNRYGNDEERGVMRAGLAISLALVGIVGALGVRRIHELLVGLTVGGAVTIFGAISYLSTIRDPSSEPVYQFVFWMATFSFLALVTILYAADNSLPRPPVAAPKVPTPVPKK